MQSTRTNGETIAPNDIFPATRMLANATFIGSMSEVEALMDFYWFLASVILVSVSGVMAPGPLFAVTVAKGSKNKIAGVLIALGHGMIEFPLMFLIYFGFAWIFAESLAQKSIGLIGGIILLYMGVQMLKSQRKYDLEVSYSRYGSIFAGILATGANPFFLLWWATIGAALIVSASAFGFVGFLVFAVLHWSCDLFWSTFVAFTVFKSRRFWTEKVRMLVFGFCIIILLGFGVWFVISALLP